MEEKKRGRKPKKTTLSETIILRVTGVHKDAFNAAAEHVGLELSAWLRGLGVAEARRLGHL